MQHYNYLHFCQETQTKFLLKEGLALDFWVKIKINNIYAHDALAFHAQVNRVKNKSALTTREILKNSQI